MTTSRVYPHRSPFTLPPLHFPLMHPLLKVTLPLILYFNARSLLPKLDILRVLCAIHTSDCVCIVESWLNNYIKNSELCINGYDVVRLDRNRHGGGVLLYINSVLTHNIVVVFFWII